jgi:hypothetical protein
MAKEMKDSRTIGNGETIKALHAEIEAILQERGQRIADLTACEERRTIAEKARDAAYKTGNRKGFDKAMDDIAKETEIAEQIRGGIRTLADRLTPIEEQDSPLFGQARARKDAADAMIAAGSAERKAADEDTQRCYGLASAINGAREILKSEPKVTQNE